MSGQISARPPLVWICGASGLLGRHMVQACRDRGYGFAASDHHVDVSSRDALERFHAGLAGITHLVNCAAWTDVAGAETHKPACEALNSFAPAVLAEFCRDQGMCLVHFSTDHVFARAVIPGKALVEADPTEPVNFYAASKLAGEEAIRSIHPDHFIVRTSWLYGQGGRNLVDTMAGLLLEGKILKAVDDQFSVPVWCADLASWTLDLMASDSPRGLYHGVPESWCSPLVLARHICKGLEKLGHPIPESLVVPVRGETYASDVKRPAWSALDPQKLASALGRPQPSWHDRLDLYLQMRYSSIT